MPEAGFFDRDGDRLVPASEAHGPWSTDMLHGRLLAGLAARAVEAVIGDPAFQPARLTIDLFRAAGLEPVEVETTVTRRGGRVRAAEVLMVSAGKEIARATALLLRTGEAPDNPVPSSPSWTSAWPGAVAASNTSAGFEMRFVPGCELGAPGIRRAWIREDRPLTTGEELTPFQRAALVADFANPLANFGRDGLDYINADITLYLGRLPRGEWIGMETTEHIAEDGVATSTCRLHDEVAPLGSSTVAAVRNPRMDLPTIATRTAGVRAGEEAVGRSEPRS